jgi:hypothetical protein
MKPREEQTDPQEIGATLSHLLRFGKFLAHWEIRQTVSAEFNYGEFAIIKSHAGLNS